jgi:hypothetical protein
VEDSENSERSSSVKRGSAAGYDDDDDGMYVCMMGEVEEGRCGDKRFYFRTPGWGIDGFSRA